MSNFVDIDTMIITTEFARGNLDAGSINRIICVNGEVAGYGYLGDTLEGYRKLQIYNSSTGEDIPVAVVLCAPGIDIFRGLFSTGAIPTKDLFDEDCVLLRVDY